MEILEGDYMHSCYECSHMTERVIKIGKELAIKLCEECIANALIMIRCQ